MAGCLIHVNPFTFAAFCAQCCVYVNAYLAVRLVVEFACVLPLLVFLPPSDYALLVLLGGHGPQWQLTNAYHFCEQN